MENIKIDYYIGDILTPHNSGEAVIICHQVNCKGVMGSGLALHIRKHFPDLYIEYKIKCENNKSSKVMLGEVLYYPVKHQECYFTIANIFGQDDFGRKGRYTDYNALEKAFKAIRHCAQPTKTHKATTIRIPRNMGCGLGGGEWKTVFKIIDKELVQKGIPVEIWELPQKNQ